MKRAALSLLLLLAVALGTMAGPHPCHAMAGMAGMEKTAAAVQPAMPVMEHPSCHGTAPVPKPAPEKEQEKDDCCDPLKGGHALCGQVCGGLAVLGAAPAPPQLRSFEEAPAVTPARPAAPFVLSIDHVPLA